MKRTNLLCDFVTYCNKSNIKISVFQNCSVNFQFHSLHFYKPNHVKIWDKIHLRKYEYICTNIEDLILIISNVEHRISLDFKLNKDKLNQYVEYRKPAFLENCASSTYDLNCHVVYQFTY